MMKMIKKMICLCLSMMLVLFACPGVRAAEEEISAKMPSLTIFFHYEDIVIDGCEFDVYKVANVEADGTIVLVGDFENAPVELDQNMTTDWDEMAVTLTGIAQAEEYTPEYIVNTNEAGLITIDEMPTGLYLVSGKKCIQGEFTYWSKPALVALPAWDREGNLNYDVTMSPKVDRTFNTDKTGNPLVSRRVIKSWVDDGNTEERPEFIEIYLLCDGVKTDTVRLTAKENWRYEWKDLPRYDTDGSEIVWTVAEKPEEGYTVRIIQVGITIMVTNTSTGVKGEHVDPPTNDQTVPPGQTLPYTGLLWWPVSVLSCMGMLCLIVGFIKRRSE